MLLMLARIYYSVIAMIRRSIGNIKVLTIIAYYPDLPPLDADRLAYIERLTSTMEYGTLSHFVADQSLGRASLRNSKVVNLGNVLPLWFNLYDLPEAEGLPPIKKKTMDTSQFLSDQFGRQLLTYDILMMYTNGALECNASTRGITINLSERFFRSHYYSFPKTLPLVKIGLPALELNYTSVLCHELFHAIQRHYFNAADHAPYIEGQESLSSSAQRNQWHNLSSERLWGTADSEGYAISVGVSAYNCSRFGWYKESEEFTIDTPVINKIVQLRTTNIPNPSPPDSSVFICHIDTTNFPNHPDGYVIEARARRGYDVNLIRSGVLVHKLDYLINATYLGPLAFHLGPYPPPSTVPYSLITWMDYVHEAGEVFERPGIRIEVTNVTLGSDGVPELFELDITVQ